jgi:hypothetical protein
LRAAPESRILFRRNFKDGKLWSNDRPGLGVELDVGQLTLLGEYATYRAGMLMNRRPDGSFMTG